MKHLALFALLAALVAPALAAPPDPHQETGYIGPKGPVNKALGITSGAGYLDPRFVGKPDCWPGSSILQPDAAFHACHLDRYGEPYQGSGGTRKICCEIFVSVGVPYWSLKHACLAGIYGPGHSCEPTMTEQYDYSYQHSAQDANSCRWWFAFQSDGGRVTEPRHTCRTDLPHGPFSGPHPQWRCPWYQYNDCEAGPPPPPVTCPNGHADPGETCETCPQDLGACPPPLPVVVWCPRPDEALLARIRSASAYVANSLIRMGRKAQILSVLDDMHAAAVYVPSTNTTGRLDCKIREVMP